MLLLPIESLLEMGRMTLADAVLHDQDYLPKVLICQDGEIKLGAYEGGFEGLLRLLAEYSTQGPIEWLAHTSDGYEEHLSTANLTTTEIRWEIENMRPGLLEDRFKAGDPQVSEAITVTLATPEKTETVTQAYNRKGDTLQWRKPSPVIESDVGRVAMVMRGAIEQSQRG